jgi:hypothetical protein
VTSFPEKRAERDALEPGIICDDEPDGGHEVAEIAT